MNAGMIVKLQSGISNPWIQEVPCTSNSIVRTATESMRVILTEKDPAASYYWRGTRDGVPCRIDINQWVSE